MTTIDSTTQSLLQRTRPVDTRLQKDAKTGRWERCIRFFSVMHLLFIAALLFCLVVVSEQWWLSAALVYLPKSPYLVPALLLLMGSLFWSRKTVWINLISLGIVAGPVMGFQIPWNPLFAQGSDRELTVVSCNVQNYEPDFSLVLREISKFNPDVVAFQEANASHPLLKKYFAEWHKAWHGEHFVASRHHPVRLKKTCWSSSFRRTTAAQFEIDGPSGRFFLYSVHQTSPRSGLTRLHPASLIDGHGSKTVEKYSVLRNVEARDTRAFISETNSSVPSIVVGDFNMPDSSSIFRQHWGNLKNAFRVAGFGYGYTSNCRDHSFWLSGVPWIRIDHILASSSWQISECQVGKKNGSDHRLIAATLHRP